MRNGARPLAALLLVLALPASAAEVDQAMSYEVCMALARHAPNKAFGQAQNWQALGGGDAAEHCIATALLEMGQYAEAAKRLEALAQTVRRDRDFRLKLLAQAAQAWLLGDDPARAEIVLGSAIEADPTDAELLVDRAQARAERGDYEGAAADLDIALALAPGRPDVLAMRASARRYLDRLQDAMLDAEKAVALAPMLPEALLERGILRRITGDDAGARRDWLQVLTSSPGSPAAVAARANLERMDVMPE